MRSSDIALVSVLTALAAVFRYVKNSVTPFQFVNIPLALAYLSAGLFSPHVGLTVAALSYLISDLTLFPGIWTPVNSVLAAVVAFLFGVFYRRFESRIAAFIVAFLLTFFYDVLSSSLLYVVFGLKLREALAWGFIGLFLPIMGGGMIGVGPLTEFFTSLLALVLIESIARRGFGRWRSE
ncbi:MAG TPA: hypothetical protein ENJ59_02300 [Thermofilum sp.]|nr:hypothetical protein [Thermofilum sp.]